jgi:hypothetical protein
VTIFKPAGPMTAAPLVMFVSDKEMRLEMELDSFLAAVAARVGNPTMMVTKGQLERALRAAGDAVLDEMKGASGTLIASALRSPE